MPTVLYCILLGIKLLLLFIKLGAWWRHQMKTGSALLTLCVGIHQTQVNSPHKGQCRGALMFSLLSAWINIWVDNHETGDLRRHRARYDVIVIEFPKDVFVRLKIQVRFFFVSRLTYYPEYNKFPSICWICYQWYHIIYKNNFRTLWLMSCFENDILKLLAIFLPGRGEYDVCKVFGFVLEIH